MTARRALARHRRAARCPWPQTSARQLLGDFAYGAEVMRKYDPGFPVARMFEALIREVAAHAARLLAWPLPLLPVLPPAASSPFTVARWLPDSGDSGWLCDLVRACPSNGPPALVAALGAPVISP